MAMKDSEYFAYINNLMGGSQGGQPGVANTNPKSGTGKPLSAKDAALRNADGTVDTSLQVDLDGDNRLKGSYTPKPSPADYTPANLYGYARAEMQDRAQAPTRLPSSEQIAADKAQARLGLDYSRAETAYRKANEAFQTKIQNTPADVDYDQATKAEREALDKAETALRQARTAYEAAGGQGHSYSFEDRASDVVKGFTTSSAAGAVNAVPTLMEYAARPEYQTNYNNFKLALDDAQAEYDAALEKAGGNTEDRAVKRAARALRTAQMDFAPYSTMTPEEFNQAGNEFLQPAYDAADQLAETSARDIARAKEGTSPFAQGAIDVTVAAGQMATDAAISAMTGIPATAVMATRVFGSASQEARQAGATIDQQALVGAASATVEVLTEKMFDGVAGIYGKGGADEIIEEVIGKMATTPAGMNALRILFSAGNEGLEEIISGGLQPLIDSIYNGKSVGQNYSEMEVADILYDGLIGAILGGGTTAVTVNSQANQAKNAEIMANQAGATTSGQADAAWNVLTGRATAEQQAAREARAADQLARGTGMTGSDLVSRYMADQRLATYDNVQARQAPTAQQEQSTQPTQAAPLSPEQAAEREVQNALSGTVTNSVATRILTDPALRGALVRLYPDLNLRGLTNSQARNAVKALSSQTQNNVAEEGVVPQSETAQAEDATAPNEAPVELNSGSTQTAPAATEVNPAPAPRPAIPTARTRIQVNAANNVASQNSAPITPANAVQVNPAQTQGQPQINPAAPAPASPNGPAPVNPNGPNTNPNAPNANPNNGQPGAPQGRIGTTETDSRGYTGRVVETQDRVFETQLSEAERQRHGLTAEEAAHVRHSDEEVDRRAQDRLKDPAAARADLLSNNNWNDEDVATAGHLILSEIEAVDNATTEAEKEKIYRRIAEIKQQWNKQGTEEARAMRQRQRFVASDIVSEAANILYGPRGKNSKALRKLTPEQKSNVMGQVRSFVKQYNGLQQGNTTDLIALINAVSRLRRTTGLFSSEDSRSINLAMNEALKQDGGEEFLRQVLLTQIKSVASDYESPGAIRQISAFRFMSMLSNAATFATNSGSNFTLGSFMESMVSNFATPFDALMAHFSGVRMVAPEANVVDPAKWKGTYDAGIRSYIEIALDAQTEDSGTGYVERKGRTFKMVGNPLERFLSTLERNNGFLLTTTDEMSKGGTRSVTKRNLQRYVDKGRSNLTPEQITEAAEREAKYRTLQQDSKIANATVKARDAVDSVAGIGNEKTGRIGLGQTIMPFARIPANAVLTSLEAHPAVATAEALWGTYKFFNAYTEAKAEADANGTQVAMDPALQQNAARAWGRIGNSALVIAAFVGMAANGILRDYDDDDYDVANQQRAEGKTGVQMNISALGRWLTGRGATEQLDDKWVNFSWMPVLNMLANFSMDVYSSYQEDKTFGERVKDFAVASYDSVVDSIMEFPAVSGISERIRAYKNSQAETGVGKFGDMVVTGVGSTLTSFVPNALRAIATGSDEYERDVSADTALGKVKNTFQAGIPGWREQLPEKLDNFGNPVETTGGALNFFDRTLIPGNVYRHDRQTDASAIIQELIGQTGNTALMPDRYAPRSIEIKGESYRLTTAERRAYQKQKQEIADMVVEASQDPTFQSATPEAQAEIVSAIEAYVKERAKAAFAESRGLEYSPTYQTLLTGNGKEGNDGYVPPLSEDNMGQYLAFTTAQNDLEKNGDYAGLQNLYMGFENLDDNTKAVLAAKDPTARLITGVDKDGARYDVPALEPQNLAQYLEFYDGYTNAMRDGDYAAVDNLLAGYMDMDPNTREVIATKDPNGLGSMRYAFDRFGMSSGTYMANKEAVYRAEANLLGDKSGGAADALAINREVHGTDADKLAALEALNQPDKQDGKRAAIVRRFDAASEYGISFDRWCLAEAYIQDHAKSVSSPSNAVLYEAAEAVGVPSWVAKEIWRKTSSDEGAIDVYDNYWSQDYVAPQQPSFTDYYNTGNGMPQETPTTPLDTYGSTPPASGDDWFSRYLASLGKLG